MKNVLAVLALLACGVVHAATALATWTNPTTRSDGSPLTNLDHLVILWGPCASVNPPTLTTIKQQQVVQPSQSGGVLLVVSIPAPVCFEMMAVDSSGLTSPPSNVVEWTPKLGAPGQPIQLN